MIVGCSQEAGDGLPHEAVSGTVTWNGQPLPGGTIQFLPASPGDVSDFSAEIKDGHYEVPTERGPLPGNYKVAIYASDPSAAPPPEAMPGETPKLPPQPIPPKYNVKTTLTAEVKAGGPNEFNFDPKK